MRPTIDADKWDGMTAAANGAGGGHDYTSEF